MEQMQLQMETLKNQMDSNFTKINDDLNNIYYETNDIKHINHNLVLLQEEMSQFHTDELPTLQKERHWQLYSRYANQSRSRLNS